MSKEDVLQRVFYDLKHGFGSQSDTLKKARRIDPTITAADVKDFVGKQAIRQRKRAPRYNSFVAFEPRQEFQMDLMDFGAQTAPRYGLVSVDIFSKKLCVVAIRDKTSELVAKGLDEVISKTGMPTDLMVDSGGEFSGAFATRVHWYGINLIVSRSPARFVERAIGTLKRMLFERTNTLGVQWHKVVGTVVERYNETKHSITKVAPDDAAEGHETEQIRERMASKATHNMKYVSIAAGDSVKIHIKPGKFAEYKSTFSRWSARVYVVSAVVWLGAQIAYKVDGMPNAILRHDLLKVAGVGGATAEQRALAARPLRPPPPPARRLAFKQPVV